MGSSSRLLLLERLEGFDAKDHRVLLWQGGLGLQLSFLADGLLKLTLLKRGQLQDLFSWGVAHHPLPAPPPRLRDEGKRLLIQGCRLDAAVHKEPFRLEIRDKGKHLLLATTADGPVRMQEGSSELRLHLPWWEQLFGFGEKTGPLDKQGCCLLFWNRDEPYYKSFSEPLYKSIPFWYWIKQGRASGCYLDNPGRITLDLGRGEREVAALKTETGPLELYLLPGPAPALVLKRYTELTGRPCLPPLWALGLHQSRFSYTSAARLLEVAQGFRKRKIPCDVLHLDIDYMEDYRSFTWNRRSFPDPEALIRELHTLGFKAVTILDPGLAAASDNPLCEEARQKGFLVRNPQGGVFTAPVWPGESAFPDFTAQAVRRWWGSLHEPLLKTGVDGIWDDMNEPAVQREQGSMPLHTRHRSDHGDCQHLEVHNIYGAQMARASFEGLARQRPSRRPFVLTRSAAAGTQRWAAGWSGDNLSDWEHLRLSLTMALNMAVSGFPLYGADIGGFGGRPDPELFARWLELGAFFGLMRVHTAKETPDQEPWSFGAPWTERNRLAIETRYRFLPYHYSLFLEAARGGPPPLCPLWFAWPEEYELARIDDQFLFGPSLLAAPSLEPGQSYRSIKLPPGRWYSFEDGQPLAAGAEACLETPFGRLPLLALAGAFIPLQEVVQHTDEKPSSVLQIKAFAGSKGAFTLIEDAGDGPPSGAGPRRRTHFEMRKDESRLIITRTLLEEACQSPFQQHHLELHGLAARPLKVTRGGRAVPLGEAARPAADRMNCFWESGRGVLHMILPVKTSLERLEIQGAPPLFATAKPPPLRALEGEGFASAPRLLLDGAVYLEAGSFFAPRPAPFLLWASWTKETLRLKASLRSPNGELLREAANENQDGLWLRWQTAGGKILEARASTRPDLRKAPVTGAQASIGVTELCLDAGRTWCLEIPRELLSHEPFQAGQEFLFNLAARHSDRHGFRIHMQWQPGPWEDPPRARIVLEGPRK